MKKFVLASKHHSLYLNEQHINWLHRNGYPEADAFFCSNDRSNPALVACVEAVHASMYPLVEEAIAMIHTEDACRELAKSDLDNKRAALMALVAVIKAAGYRYYENNIISSLVSFLDTNMSWEQAEPWLNSHFRVRVENGKQAYEQYVASLNKPSLVALSEASTELIEFCEKHGLRRHFNTIEIDDGYVIKTFDETRFTAKAVGCDDEYDEYSSGWEKMELTPFVTRATIDSFVAKGDTDGMMEYLRSLRLDLNIEE